MMQMREDRMREDVIGRIGPISLIRLIRPIGPMKTYEKTLLFRVFFHYVYSKPNFVVDSYLSRQVIAHMLKRHFCASADTALHWGKDFAVSPSYHYEAILRGESFDFRLRRHCSHLLDYSRRGLPATFLTRALSFDYSLIQCSDFPPEQLTYVCYSSNCLIHLSIITHKSQNEKYNSIRQ